MENKEANDLIVSITNMVEFNEETKTSKGFKRKYVDDFNQAIKQVIKDEVVITKEEEVVIPKEEDEEVVTRKEEEVVTSKEADEEVVTLKEADEELVTPKEADENNVLKNEAIVSLNDHEIVDTKEENVNKLSLVELLKQYITNKTLMNDIELNLDERTKICLMFILQTYPRELYGIDKLVELVIADGKIDINDLPLIIKFCGTIYGLVKNANMDHKTAIDISCIILKFIMRVLLSEKKIKLDNTDKMHFIKSFDCLVDECFAILKQNEIVQKGCDTFFKKMLCKK